MEEKIMITLHLQWRSSQNWSWHVELGIMRIFITDIGVSAALLSAADVSDHNKLWLKQSDILRTSAIPTFLWLKMQSKLETLHCRKRRRRVSWRRHKQTHKQKKQRAVQNEQQIKPLRMIISHCPQKSAINGSHFHSINLSFNIKYQNCSNCTSTR